MSSQPANDFQSHRWLGQQMDLFHFPPSSPGMAFWHSRGMVLRHALYQYCRELGSRYEYQEVLSPMLCNHSLWQQSGHAEKFSDKMFNLEVEGRMAALKPMNCPGHAELFKLRPRSFKELPLRISELGHVHRLEQSGSLNGLLRARSFVIDDAHLFCMPQQIQQELDDCLAMAQEVYQVFGLALHAELSLRPEQRLGSDLQWDQAEQALRSALMNSGLEFSESPGEGAFYGPKVDLHVEDSLGRMWQMGSVQLDFQLPERFDLRFVSAENSDCDENGKPNRPVMIHRAMFGSIERLIGILIEHYDGWFPLWLAPQVVSVLPIGKDDNDYAADLCQQFNSQGIIAQVDGDAPLGQRIARAKQQRIPVVVVVGSKERQSGQAMLQRASGRKIQEIQQAIEDLVLEIKNRQPLQ